MLSTIKSSYSCVGLIFESAARNSRVASRIRGNQRYLFERPTFFVPIAVIVVRTGATPQDHTIFVRTAQKPNPQRKPKEKPTWQTTISIRSKRLWRLQTAANAGGESHLLDLSFHLRLSQMLYKFGHAPHYAIAGAVP